MPGYVTPVIFVSLVVLVQGVVGGCLAANRGRNVQLSAMHCFHR